MDLPLAYQNMENMKPKSRDLMMIESLLGEPFVGTEGNSISAMTGFSRCT